MTVTKLYGHKPSTAQAWLRTQQQTAQEELATKAWGDWPAKNPYDRAPLEDLSRDLPFQMLITSS